MFAVDYPCQGSQIATGFLDALDLSQDQRTLVSQANAEQLFPHPTRGLAPVR